jgi:hypothetical protein
MSKRADPQIDLSAIGPDTPLRLNIAAKLFYPDGSMKASGLRREISRGRLKCERTAGKQYVTQSYIEQMRAKCRDDQKAPASTSASDADVMPSGSSSMEKTRSALVAAQTVAEELKRPSPATSQRSTGQTGRIVTLLR